jgi:hypothetical protein
MALTTISNYLADALLNHVFGGTPYTAPTTVYVSLYTSDPQPDDSGTETTYGNYARQAISFGSVTAHQILNDTLITFPAASAAGVPAVITHMGMHDAVSGGNLLSFAALGSSVTINEGTAAPINIGGLVAEFI